MKWQQFLKDYLSFTRKDRIGVLVLVSLIVLVYFLPLLLPSKTGSKITPADSAWIASMKAIEEKVEKTGFRNYSSKETKNKYRFDPTGYEEKERPPGELFLFDPNTLNPEGWKKLGLKDKLIQTIQNYLHRGGHFKNPDDLQKIYGLRPEDFKRLETFIRIEQIPVTNIPASSNDSLVKIIQHPAVVKKSIALIDINIADTTAFISLPGIGSRLAARIVGFREKLGGFYAIDQVAETFALPDSTYRLIKPFLILENKTLRKININTATLEELKAHPYLRWNIANPVIAYRSEHGPFTSVEGLKKVMAVTEEIYQKILPYLEL